MGAFKILVVEDDPAVRDSLAQLLKENYRVECASDGETALALTESQLFDAALVDINLPDMTGLSVLEALKSRIPEMDVVMMTGYPEFETAVQALRLGASDYLVKPLEWIALEHVLRRITEHRHLRAEVAFLRERLAEKPSVDELIGSSPAIRRIRELINKVAPTDSVVLIEGESGTGKELIAAAIHRLSLRDGPFVPVNCAAIPADLMESELFGHVRGAFSGATAHASGLFRSAEKGTLFLDEVGELPLAMQPKLLRALQEKAIRPVGSPQAQPVDVRIIAATNRNLPDAVQTGQFRQDLFFRLNVVRIESPPLRQLKEDIPALSMHVIGKLNRRFGRKVRGVKAEAMAALAAYDFPGNVRELENIIERAYVLGAKEWITASDLPVLGHRSDADNPKRRIEDLERELIVEMLGACGDNRREAARALGMSERTLYRRLKKFGLA